MIRKSDTPQSTSRPTVTPAAAGPKAEPLVIDLSSLGSLRELFGDSPLFKFESPSCCDPSYRVKDEPKIEQSMIEYELTRYEDTLMLTFPFPGFSVSCPKEVSVEWKLADDTLSITITGKKEKGVHAGMHSRCVMKNIVEAKTTITIPRQPKETPGMEVFKASALEGNCGIIGIKLPLRPAGAALSGKL